RRRVHRPGGEDRREQRDAETDHRLGAGGERACGRRAVEEALHRIVRGARQPTVTGRGHAGEVRQEARAVETSGTDRHGAVQDHRLETRPVHLAHQVRRLHTPPNDREPTGVGGDRTAKVHSVRWTPVTEAETRLAGLRRKEFHFAESLPQTSYESVKSDPRLTRYVNDT